MRRAVVAFVPVLFAALPAVVAAQGVVLDDSLRGSSSGTVGGGSFGPDGWRVVTKDDYIYWHILDTSMAMGAVEFSVRGLRSRDTRPEGADKNEIFHMYDWTFQDADTNYTGYRNNNYKHFIRKTNEYDATTGSFSSKTDSLEMLWQIIPGSTEPDTSVLTWDPAVTYRFREEWGPDGQGNSEVKTYRDGILINTMSVPGEWNPAGLSVRIAASTRAPLYPDFGAPLDAVFSDVKVWSFSGPHVGSRHESANLAHRCGCSSIPSGIPVIPGIVASALLASFLRRRFTR
jgi:hypothetical protein